MVRALALEGLAASEAGAGSGRARLAVNVAAVRRREIAGPHHRSALDQRPHHAQGDGLPAGQLIDRDQLRRVRGADHVNPHLAHAPGWRNSPKNAPSSAASTRNSRAILRTMGTVGRARVVIEQGDIAVAEVRIARSLTYHGAAVVLIHHATKAEGSTPREHSVLNGALDVALQLSAAPALTRPA